MMPKSYVVDFLYLIISVWDYLIRFKIVINQLMMFAEAVI